MEDELNRLKGDHKMSVKEILSRTMQYVKPELLSFILAIVLLAINVALDITLPILTGKITDALEAEKVKGIKAYIIVWYYNHDICKAFRTSYIYSLIQAGKKSVSSDDTNGILIPGVKRKKYYDWDWSVLFK